MEINELPIDFRHLETFCKVAQLKSFSKAAQELYLTQPTVSGHILSIERFLSLQLFDRGGKEVRLTKAGKVFFKCALKILNSRKELFSALSEFVQGIRGELSIGASTIPGEYILPKIIKYFKDYKPGPYLISIKIGDTKEVIKYLLDGLVEFGITGGKISHNELRYEKFIEDQVIVISPANYYKKIKSNLNNLIKEPWIIREEGSGTQMAVEKILKRKGLSLKNFNVVMEMGSTSSVKEGVKAGLGLAFISKRAVEDELNSGLIFRVELKEIDPLTREIYLVTPRNRSLSPLANQFIQFLRENIERI